MKKMISVILAVLLMFSLSISAFAQSTDNEEEMTMRDKLWQYCGEMVDRYNIVPDIIPGYVAQFYSKASLDRAISARDKANALFERSDATDEEYQQVYEEVKYVMEHSYVSKRWLRETYEIASLEENINGWYDENLWNEFQSVLNEVKEAINSDDEQAVDSAYYLLRVTFNKLCNLHRIHGDVNGDGVVNIRDATIVQKYVNKLVELTSNQQLLACSVNTSPFGIIRQRDFYFDSGTKSYEYYPADEVKDLSIDIRCATKIQKVLSLVEEPYEVKAEYDFGDDYMRRNPILEFEHYKPYENRYESE